MKNIKKWFMNLDMLWIFMISFVVLVFAMEQADAVELKTAYVVVFIPLFMMLFQNFFQKRQDNNCANIDLFLHTEIAERMIAWGLESEIKKSEKAIATITNTGNVDIFELYIKVEKSDGATSFFWIDEHISSSQFVCMLLPAKIEEITKITITYSLQWESKTKEFEGVCTGDKQKTIFSCSNKLNSEKNALYKKCGYDTFKKLKRYMIINER